MDSFFPTAKIYNPKGQKYTAVDRELFLAYKESEHGQILHTGINEAGSMAAFTAAGTSYATHGEPMIPVYVFYSMFGFQRTGDSMWAAMDQMARGFIIGATAGRTTLTGEGLQHADGHSPMLASTNPAMKIYDPAYGYEIAHIVRAGLEQMYGAGLRRPATSCTTSPSTTSRSPSRPSPRTSTSRASSRASTGSAAAVATGPKVQLLASGVSVPWALEAALSPRPRSGGSAPTSGRSPPGPSCAATAWPRRSTTSCTPTSEPQVPYVTRKLADAAGPDRRLHRLHVGRAGPDPAVPAEPVRHPRRRRPRLLRHPGRRPGATSTSTPTRSWSGPCRCSPRPARSTPSAPEGGGGEVPAARRQRRHHRQRGRRLVTVARSGPAAGSAPR